MTQYVYKIAMRNFGDKTGQAVTKELVQIHQRAAFAPQDANKLTYEQRQT